jgi:hypothetical protein
MRWTPFLIFGLFGVLNLLLSMEADGLLAGFGYLSAALFFVLALLNVLRPRK